MSAPAVDPAALALAARFAELEIPTPDEAGVVRGRELMERVTRLQPPARELPDVHDRLLPGAAGRLPARVYDPGPATATATATATGDATARPLVLHLHGGGWVAGSIEVADRPCRELAALSGCRVVSLGYRLAPENPFPGPLHDCLAATRALLDDPALGAGGLALVGDSAGGNLAAATALALRDERPDALRAQILIYPCLHPARDSPYPSYAQHAQAPLMSTRELAWYWDMYLADPADGRDPLAAPVLAEDLSGLAPATILLAGVDALHDEGAAYAHRLRDAGVPVTVRTWEDQPHGFWWMGKALPRARELTEAIADALHAAATTATSAERTRDGAA